MNNISVNDVSMTSSMSSSSSSMDLKESLREIATLLMLIHEQYFKNNIGIQNTILSLIQFVDDVGMHDYVSIVDIESSRSKCNSNSLVFDSNQFYEWLKLIANTVFYYSFKNDKKNLYYLLVTYLLPYASNSNNNSNNQRHSNSSTNPLQSNILTAQNYHDLTIPTNLSTTLIYSNFLKLLFTTIIRGSTTAHVSNKYY